MRSLAIRVGQRPARAARPAAPAPGAAQATRLPRRDEGPTIRPRASVLFADTPAMESHGTGCGCAGCAGGTAAPATVRLSHPPAPAGLAVVQRCRKDPSCPNTDPCPVHDAYAQSDDPSAQPFIRQGRGFMGEDAMRRQQAGHAPNAADVREQARQTPAIQHGGSGLDEGLATSERGGVAARQQPGEAGVQSGLRGSTDLTVGRSPTGPVAGHTGMFRAPGGHGSTNTSGQAAFHDVRRQPPPAAAIPEEVVTHYAGLYAGSLATGQDILQSPNLTGGVPNLRGFGALEPPAAGGAPPGPNRAGLARPLHAQREHVKDRGRSFALAHGLPAPMSPQRNTDGDFGYLQPTDPPRPASPLPYFPGADDDERAAHASAWITAPKRHRYEAEHTPRTCGTCGHANPLGAVHCGNCHARL